ncbi:MAG: sugar phosphate nucleotidyltransferase, partial [Planctomycetota bacterium]|nr:sugar phosphate nucleotidyltransferase [Planctomycetota bacterium]
GTRAYPYTNFLPKPMMPIAGQPILLHVMQIYASHGHTEFILSVGWRKEVIYDYFHRKHLDWDIQIVDTGEETDTGGRILNCKHLLRDKFMATYADGLSDVPINELIAFHDRHDGLATMTSVPLRSQYGTLECDADARVTDFHELPVLREHWIYAGFFVFDKAVFDHWKGANLERDVFVDLVNQRRLYSYRHDGFFKSMDTQKDQDEIERMYAEGLMPWRLDVPTMPASNGEVRVKVAQRQPA